MTDDELLELLRSCERLTLPLSESLRPAAFHALVQSRLSLGARAAESQPLAVRGAGHVPVRVEPGVLFKRARSLRARLLVAIGIAAQETGAASVTEAVALLERYRQPIPQNVHRDVSRLIGDGLVESSDSKNARGARFSLTSEGRKQVHDLQNEA